MDRTSCADALSWAARFASAAFLWVALGSGAAPTSASSALMAGPTIATSPTVCNLSVTMVHGCCSAETHQCTGQLTRMSQHCVLGPTSNMQLLGGLEQVLAQLWRQCGEEAAVDQPGQGGIEYEAQ